jgi:hypothetical protein
MKRTCLLREKKKTKNTASSSSKTEWLVVKLPSHKTPAKGGFIRKKYRQSIYGLIIICVLITSTIFCFLSFVIFVPRVFIYIIITCVIIDLIPSQRSLLSWWERRRKTFDNIGKEFPRNTDVAMLCYVIGCSKSQCHSLLECNKCIWPYLNLLPWFFVHN